MSMAEIIRKANSNTVTSTGIKPHLLPTKSPHSPPKRIPPLHAHRKKQLELEEEEELEAEERYRDGLRGLVGPFVLFASDCVSGLLRTNDALLFIPCVRRARESKIQIWPDEKCGT